jgi:hypothetical protein
VGVHVTPTAHPQGIALPGINRYWTVTQSGLSDFTCEASFDYLDGDLNLGTYTEADLRTLKYGAAGWMVGEAPDTANNRLSMTADSFSDFTAGPAVVSLEASPWVYPSILLNWKLLNELEALGFNLYRADSLDGTRQKVNSELIPADDSELYSFIDPGPIAPGGAYYWIEVVRTEGNILAEDQVVFIAASQRPVFMPYLRK